MGSPRPSASSGSSVGYKSPGVLSPKEKVAKVAEETIVSPNGSVQVFLTNLTEVSPGRWKQSISLKWEGSQKRKPMQWGLDFARRSAVITADNQRLFSIKVSGSQVKYIEGMQVQDSSISYQFRVANARHRDIQSIFPSRTGKLLAITYGPVGGDTRRMEIVDTSSAEGNSKGSVVKKYNVPSGTKIDSVFFNGVAEDLDAEVQLSKDAKVLLQGTRGKGAYIEAVTRKTKSK